MEGGENTGDEQSNKRRKIDLPPPPKVPLEEERVADIKKLFRARAREVRLIIFSVTDTESDQRLGQGNSN
jgi:hypothetical protein